MHTKHYTTQRHGVVCVCLAEEVKTSEPLKTQCLKENSQRRACDKRLFDNTSSHCGLVARGKGERKSEGGSLHCWSPHPLYMHRVFLRRGNPIGSSELESTHKVANRKKNGQAGH